MDGPVIKCGYCGFILRGSCETILNHHCFNVYKENVDDNAVVTMRRRHESEMSVVQHPKEGASRSALTQNELLIMLVRTQRGLWDHSIPLSERTKLKKDSMWQEIVNVFEGSLSMETVKQRWKQLRDSYIKARKKMQGYVRSGSGAESGHPLKSSFAHYEEMRFLDDTVKIAPNVSSIQRFLESNSSHDNVVDNMQVDMTTNKLTDSEDSSICSPSNLSQSSFSSSRLKRKIRSSCAMSDAQKQAEIENKFLSIIDEASNKKRDVVDSFLDQLGDILRRLPYIRRRNLQKRLMDIARRGGCRD